MHNEAQIGNNIFRLTKTKNGYISELVRAVLTAEWKAPAQFGEQRILGKFESESKPGTFHYVIQLSRGSFYCTCYGYRSPNRCWHYQLITEIGPQSIKETIILTLKEIKEAEARVKSKGGA